MNFGEALELLKTGEILRRKMWPWPCRVDMEPGAQFLITLFADTYREDLFVENADAFTTFPVLVYRDAIGCVNRAWLPAIPDLIAEDWEVFTSKGR